MRLLIALPVLDEEKVLEDSVGKIVAVCRSDFPDDETVIVISDNGSADRTGEIGK
jgi:glycosyltransferase involved in cell wall biosynthesis